MNNDLPKVSIVLPTYNGSKYIGQSIESCLNQTYRDIELIIVDDASTDETPKIVKSYADPRLVYIRHEKNMKLPVALNTGFSRASGDYLTWTSDDNFYDVSAIDRMLSFMRDNACDFVYCDYYKVKDGTSSEKKIVHLPDSLDLSVRNEVGACFLYSRAVKEAVGDYDTEMFLAEDYDYWIRVEKRFPMRHLAETLYSYRDHAKALVVSRFYEVKMVDILVRFKHGLLTAKSAAEKLISLAANDQVRLYRVRKVTKRILLAGKISENLSAYRNGKITFTQLRAAILKMLYRTNDVSRKQ